MLVTKKLTPGHRVHANVLGSVFEEIFAEAGHNVALDAADIQHQAVLVHLLVVFFYKLYDVFRRQTKDRHIRILCRCRADHYDIGFDVFLLKFV